MAEEFSKVWSGLNKVNLTPSPGESKGGEQGAEPV